MENRHLPVGVIQICCIAPGPPMSASSKVSPALMVTQGEIFHPWPRSRAHAAPFPSVAMPPLPFSPLKFSGESERLFALERRGRFPRLRPSPLYVITRGSPVCKRLQAKCSQNVWSCWPGHYSGSMRFVHIIPPRGPMRFIWRVSPARTMRWGDGQASMGSGNTLRSSGGNTRFTHEKAGPCGPAAALVGAGKRKKASMSSDILAPRLSFQCGRLAYSPGGSR